MSARLCPCGKPLVARQPWQFQPRFCSECAARRQREKRLRYRSSPRGKIVYAAWTDRVAAHRRELAAALRAKRRKSGEIVRCQGIGCHSTWRRTRYNGAKKWCWACAGVFYGAGYARRRRRLDTRRARAAVAA